MKQETKERICLIVGLIFCVAALLLGSYIFCGGGTITESKTTKNVVSAPDPQIVVSVDIPKPEPKVITLEAKGGDPTLEYREAARYLAKTIYGEARGCSVTEQAAVVWCILNRVDQRDTQTPEDIIKVVTAKGQFHGYSKNNPVWDEHYDLALDVLQRWLSERAGASETGRVLPAEYLYFAAKDGHNRFRDAYKGGNYWDWSLPSPYEED